MHGRFQYVTDLRCLGRVARRGTRYANEVSAIDLQDGDWFDYDEKAGEEVSVKDMKWRYGVLEAGTEERRGLEYCDRHIPLFASCIHASYEISSSFR